MEIIETSTFLYAAVIAGIVVEAVKQIGKIPSSFLPLLSLAVGTGVGLVFDLSLIGGPPGVVGGGSASGVFGVGLVFDLSLIGGLTGFVAGASASGIYDVVKKSVLQK